jgi:hypothetical protein
MLGEARRFHYFECKARSSLWRELPGSSGEEQRHQRVEEGRIQEESHGDQGAIVVMSGPLAIGSTDDVTIAAEGDMLGALFDEAAALVAVLDLPWYWRDTFLP